MLATDRSWFLVPGSWFLVPGSWFLVPGSWFLVRGSWFVAKMKQRASGRSKLNHEPRTTNHAPTCVIAVRVIPRAGRSGVAGARGDALLVRLNAAPVDGAANAELVDLLAGTLGVSKRAIEIVSGARSRQKKVRVTGLTLEEAESRLRAG
jgi:uncharacterized protein (TIGR00251 family)